MFDFTLDHRGELIFESSDNDILKSEDNDFKLQTAFNRLMSVSTNWFYDETGADMEQLIGKECSKDMADYGKSLITNILTFDELWDRDDFYIKSKIKDNVHINYGIYFKITESGDDDPYAYNINIELDLIKGVFVRYGWMPRNKVYMSNLSRGRIQSIKLLINTTKSYSDRLNLKIKKYELEPFTTWKDEITEFERLREKYLGYVWDEAELGPMISRFREINHDLTKAYAEFDDYVMAYKASKKNEILNYLKIDKELVQKYEELVAAIVSFTQNPNPFSTILKNAQDYYKIKSEFPLKPLSGTTEEELNAIANRVKEIEDIFTKALKEQEDFEWPELEIWV